MASRNIRVLDLETRIKKRLRKHLEETGFYRASDGSLQLADQNKEYFRQLHNPQRLAKLVEEKSFAANAWPTYSRYFADGINLVPEKISPRLQMIDDSSSNLGELFRLATLTWSIPVSRGYGRRIRFLVWDDSNDKLIGLIALGDPVFNLSVRDSTIGWTSDQRKSNLIHTMDAYVLGALPPYNMLLGGKLVAALIRTTEIRDCFRRKYGDSRGIISGAKKNPKLVLVTTTSALGRSSVYNRLSLEQKPYLTPIGFTAGWGHFHVPDDLFNDMRKLLHQRGHQYAGNHQFGQGPNWRLRTIRAALEALGENPSILQHGIRREVFVCRLAKNADRFLRGEVTRPLYTDLKSTSEVASLALARWIVPRSIRIPDYVTWRKEHIWTHLYGTGAFRPQQLQLYEE